MKRSITALSLFALLFTSCSTRDSDAGESPAAVGDASSTIAESTAHVGDTLNLTRADGLKVAVTLTQIINPATVANAAPDPGKTYVATKLTITDKDAKPEEGDVNINVSMVGSDDQIYTPDLHDVAECTNFDSGAFHLAPGESTTGCVVFALPQGVTPARVKYLPSAGFASSFGEWLIS